MRAWVENQRYFCTLTRCRPCLFRMKVDFQDLVYGISYRTGVQNFKTTGKCTTQVLTIKDNFLSVLALPESAYRDGCSQRGVNRSAPNLATTHTAISSLYAKFKNSPIINDSGLNLRVAERYMAKNRTF